MEIYSYKDNKYNRYNTNEITPIPILKNYKMVKVSGNNLILNTIKAKCKITLLPNLFQNGSPSFDEPININVVTGKNNIILTNNDNTLKQNYEINFNNKIYGIINKYKNEIIGTPNNWIFKERIVKVIFDKAHNIQGDGTNTIRADLVATPEYLKFTNASTENPCMYCNRTVFANNTQDNEHIYIGNWLQVEEGHVGNPRLFLNHSRLNGYDKTLPSGEKLKLVNNYLKDNPLICYFILPEENEIIIEDNELINELNNLYNLATTYENKTYINVENEENNAPLNLVIEVLEERNE